MTNTLSFSAIIPTHNRPSSLHACLQALAGQKCPESDFEVLIVDDGSIPPVPDSILAEFPRLRLSLLRSPQNEGPASARNRGAERARGQYLAFTDDDCLPEPDWLSELRRSLSTCPSIAVGGRIAYGGEDIFSATSHAILEAAYAYYNNPVGRPQFFASLNLAVPAKEYREIGGFLPEFRTSEDREFCARWLQHGYALAFAPEAVVIHQLAPGLRPFLRRHYGYGKGAYRFRLLQAKIRGSRLVFESPGFYRQLIYPLRSNQSLAQKNAVSFLAIISQFASLSGFLAERWNMKHASK